MAETEHVINHGFVHIKSNVASRLGLEYVLLWS